MALTDGFTASIRPRWASMTSRLDTCLDASPDGWPQPNPEPAATSTPPADRSPGLSPWDPAAAPRKQLKAASGLHAAAGLGTANVLWGDDRPLPAEEATSLLRWAWEQTEILRLRFLPLPVQRRQLTAPWEQ